METSCRHLGAAAFNQRKPIEMLNQLIAATASLRLNAFFGRHGITSLGDVLQRHDEELLKLPGLTLALAAEIDDLLSRTESAPQSVPTDDVAPSPSAPSHRRKPEDKHIPSTQAIPIPKDDCCEISFGRLRTALINIMRRDGLVTETSLMIAVEEKFGSPNHALPAMERILEILGTIGDRQALEDGASFWIPAIGDTRLSKRLKSILSVSPYVSLRHIRDALRRRGINDKSGFAIGDDALWSYCAQQNFCRIEEDCLVATVHLDSEELLSAGDKAIRSSLIERGGYGSWADLKSALITTHEYEPSSATGMLSTSCIVTGHPHQIIALIGTAVPSSAYVMAEQALSKRSNAPIHEWRFDIDGRLLMTVSLTQRMVVTGEAFIKAAFATYMQGYFEYLADGRAYRLYCHDTLIRGLRPGYLAMEAVPGETITVAFDITDRTATIVRCGESDPSPISRAAAA